jgi:hypothetical protein
MSFGGSPKANQTGTARQVRQEHLRELTLTPNETHPWNVGAFAAATAGLSGASSPTPLSSTGASSDPVRS